MLCIYCPTCDDVMKVVDVRRTCRCGASECYYPAGDEEALPVVCGSGVVFTVDRDVLAGIASGELRDIPAWPIRTHQELYVRRR